MAKRDQRLILVGRQMSNVLHNLGQRGDGVSNINLAAHEYKIFPELWQEWDAALREYRQSFKRKKNT